jgi:glycosyltransferase involved in cell wall biosynthesis
MTKVTGIGTFIMDLTTILDKEGVGWFIICPKTFSEEDKTTTLRLDIDTKKVIETANPPYRRFKTIFSLLPMLSVIVKRRKDIDILHLHTFSPMTMISLVVSKLFGMPSIVTIHGKMPESNKKGIKIIMSISKGLILTFCNSLVHVSKESQESQTPNKGIIILNGIDTQLFYPNNSRRLEIRTKLNISEDLLLFIFASRWAENKGVYDLLDAFTSLSPEKLKHCKLILIGGGVDIPVKRIIKNSANSNSIISVGELPRYEVMNYYLASDIFILPSYFEGLPISLLEAMSCGLVPIVSNVGGNPEVVEHGQDGFLIKPKDVVSLRDRLEWCIVNKELLSKIGKKARMKIVTKFNAESQYENYIKIYKSLSNKDS